MGKTNNTSAQLKEKVSQDFLRMAPDALDALHDIMTNENINPLARVQAIAVILDRGMGKPEESIRIQDDVLDRDTARARLEEIAKRIRKEIDGETEEKVPLKKGSSQKKAE